MATSHSIGECDVAMAMIYSMTMMISTKEDDSTVYRPYVHTQVHMVHN